MSLRRTLSLVAVVIAVAGVTSCNKYGYDAAIESVDQDARFVTVRGWYQDLYPDSRRSSCPNVRILVDGLPHPDATVDFRCVVPEGRRADIEAAKGGQANGYSVVLANVDRGRHELCVDVLPIAFPSSATQLDCTTVEVPYNKFDGGAVDTGSVWGDVITADGWFSHIPRTSDPAGGAVRWAVDDVWVRPDTPGAATTTVDRPDARADAGPTAMGYHLIMPVARGWGSHRVCLGYDDGASRTVANARVVCRNVLV